MSLNLKFVRKRKGQYLILEEMLVFSIGIMVTISLLSTFHLFRRETKDGATKNQAELIANSVASSVFNLVQTEGSGKAEISVPKHIAGDLYYVDLEDGLVEVTIQGEEYKSQIIRSNQGVDLEGGKRSLSGEVELVYDGEDKIKLE